MNTKLLREQQNTINRKHIAIIYTINQIELHRFVTRIYSRDKHVHWPGMGVTSIASQRQGLYHVVQAPLWPSIFALPHRRDAQTQAWQERPPVGVPADTASYRGKLKFFLCTHHQNV